MGTVVVTDTVVTNLILGGAPELFARLPDHVFVAVDEVVDEIVDPAQAAVLARVLRAGGLRRETLTGSKGLRLFAELRAAMGRSEAASLALAQARGWSLASDERRLFLGEALARLGPGRVLNTPGLLVLAIRAGALTVETADGIKAILEGRRLRMRFRSFRDVA